MGDSYGADDSYTLYEEPLLKVSSILASTIHRHVRGNNIGGQNEIKEALRGHLQREVDM